MSRRLLALSGFALLVAAFAGCTPDPSPTPTGTATYVLSPAPSPTPADSIFGQLVPVPLSVAQGTDPGDAEGQSLNIPEGWTAEIWANLPNARLATWTTEGTLLVSSPATETVVALTPTEPGKAPTASDVLTGLNGPQGLAFALNGKLLVVGEEDQIVAYDYLGGEATNPRILVDDLPSSGHASKGIAVNGSTVYYSLGSESNRDPADRTTEPERATVSQVGIDGQGNSIVGALDRLNTWSTTIHTSLY